MTRHKTAFSVSYFRAAPYPLPTCERQRQEIRVLNWSDFMDFADKAAEEMDLAGAFEAADGEVPR